MEVLFLSEYGRACTLINQCLTSKDPAVVLQGPICDGPVEFSLAEEDYVHLLAYYKVHDHSYLCAHPASDADGRHADGL